MWGSNYEELHPLILGKNGEIWQFFTAVIKGEIVGVFSVNHAEYPSATSWIVEENRQGRQFPPFDYVRSSTRKEVAAIIVKESQASAG